MTAGFRQTDRKGRTLTGTLTLKRPGKLRFQYQKGVPMLIVADGRKLNMIDYETKRVDSWPIGNSPLGVLLNPNQDLSRIAKVVRNDAQTLLVQARDPKKPEFGTITLGFAKVAERPGRAAAAGLDGGRRPEQPHHREAVRPALQRRRRRQRLHLPAARRKGAQGLNAIHPRDRNETLKHILRLRVVAVGFSPCCPARRRNRASRRPRLVGPRSTPPERGPLRLRRPLPLEP